MIPSSLVELHSAQLLAVTELRRLGFHSSDLEWAATPADIHHEAIVAERQIFAARMLAMKLDVFARADAITLPAQRALEELQRVAADELLCVTREVG